MSRLAELKNPQERATFCSFAWENATKLFRICAMEMENPAQWYKRRAPRKIKTFYVTLFTATVMYIEAFFNKISLETHPVFKQLLAEEENGP